MRTAFFNVLLEKFRADENTYLLTGDLGYKLFDGFGEASSKRFCNVGVAEANMVGLSTGLALCGKKVFCYTLAPFLIRRAFEQICIGVSDHGLDVKLVGAGGGFTYGMQGLTHFGTDDLSLMKSLPDMIIEVPADAMEAEILAGLSYECLSPMYIRLGRAGETTIHDDIPDYTIGKGMVLADGKDLVIFAVGSMVQKSIDALKILRKKGLNASLVNMHTIRPLDGQLVTELSKTHGAIFTVEEHSITGGLGSSVAEILAESGYAGKFKRIGIPNKLKPDMGDTEYLRSLYGLDAEGIFTIISQAMDSRT